MVAPRLLNTFKEEASSNQARVEEVLQKKLRKKSDLRKDGSHSGYTGPQGTRDAQSNRARADVPRGKAKDESVSLGAEELLAFERQGHLSTRGVLSEAQVLAVRRAAERAITDRSTEALQQRIRVLLPRDQHIAVTSEQQGLQYLKTHRKELGFLQHFNLHR